MNSDNTNTQKGSKFALSGANYVNRITPVTFRIYAYNAEDSTGTFGIDSLFIQGTAGLIENTQNYMDYSYCSKMYTLGQKDRMRAALQSAVSHRSNLWSAANLAATGVLTPQNCLSKADFFSNKNRVCAGDIVKFTKNTHLGTADSVKWTFYGGTPFNSNSMTTVNVTYPNAGIYKVTLTTYNSAGTDSLTKTDYIRVDPTWADVDYNGAFSETFEDPSHFYGIWSINNYDNNNTWTRFTSAGYQSNSCMKMAGFGNYQYDVDDLYTPSYDLSWTSGNIMTFRVAAASHGGSVTEVNDVLKVYASKNCGTTWTILPSGTFSDSTLINNGYYPNAFTPTASSNWSLKTIAIPSTFNTGNVRFKFEYTTGAESNNVYLDNLNITGVVGIDESSNATSSLAIYPNPANESSTIAYHLNKKANTKVEVIDILGKAVFVQSNSGQAEGDYTVHISKQALNLESGIYFVKFSVEDKSTTKKLVISE
jgi:PKD repeat protein